MSISNFGEKTLEEVYKALEAIGFCRAVEAPGGGGRGSPPCRPGVRGDPLWLASSDSMKRSGGTGGPAPRLVGSAGEAVFFAVFLALGCTWLVWGFVSIIIPRVAA